MQVSQGVGHARAMDKASKAVEGASFEAIVEGGLSRLFARLFARLAIEAVVFGFDGKGEDGRARSFEGCALAFLRSLVGETVEAGCVRMVAVVREPSPQFRCVRAVGARMHVALEQKMSQQNFVFEGSDELVGFFPLRSFLECEDAFVGGGVLCREQAGVVLGENGFGEDGSFRCRRSFASLLVVFLDQSEKGFCPLL